MKQICHNCNYFQFEKYIDGGAPSNEYGKCLYNYYVYGSEPELTTGDSGRNCDGYCDEFDDRLNV